MELRATLVPIHHRFTHKIQGGAYNCHSLKLTFTVNEPPVEERIVDECLEHSHHAVLVLPQHSHDIVTRLTEVTLNSSHLGERELLQH